MKCYAQFTGPNLAPPMPDQYETFESVAECRRAFLRFVEKMDRYINGLECEGFIFFGDPEGNNPCDTYPDRVISVGPRFGVRVRDC